MKRGPLPYIIAFVLPLAFSCLNVIGLAHAQQARVELTPDEILMGQHGRMVIEAEAPSGGHIILPVFADTITGEIEVIGFGSPDTLHKDDKLIALRQTLVITAWEEGYYPVPRQLFKYVFEGDTTLFESQAALLQVKGVEVDMAEKYRDIRPIWLIPLTLWELLRWVLPVIAVALLLFFLIKWLRGRKVRLAEPDIWEKPDVPAHIAAISSLETLRRKELWQGGKIKLYHSELTTILRLYLRKRFGVNAMEMTTAEIMHLLPQKTRDAALTEKARGILEMADLVKFAKHQPGPEVHEQVLELALEFVRKTIPDDAGTQKKTETMELTRHVKVIDKGRK